MDDKQKEILREKFKKASEFIKKHKNTILEVTRTEEFVKYVFGNADKET